MDHAAADGDGQAVLDTARELADMYADAVRDLARHWPDDDGTCLGCGELYPCAEEWITMRAITSIEARWRRAGKRLEALRRGDERMSG